MPARDGTGPMGTGPRGRGMGPCRNAVANTQAAEQVKDAAGGTTADQQAPAAYGVGRGGKPRGCGRGFCGCRRR